MKIFAFIFALLIVSTVPAQTVGSQRPSEATGALRLQCEGDSVDATVYINGKIKGECPMDMSVPEGTVVIHAVKKIGDTKEAVFDKTVFVGEGIAKRVQIELGAPKLTVEAQRIEDERIQRKQQEDARLAEEKRQRELEAIRQKQERLNGVLANLKSRGAEPGNGVPFKDCPECPEMVLIPEGTFLMGSNADQPVHRVAIRSFAVGRYAVTKGQFAAFVQVQGYVTEAERSGGCVGWSDGLFGGEGKLDQIYNWRNVGFSQSDDHPVVCVSWNDARAYTQWISHKTGENYRLLSESEREYVTRAGSTTTYWWGDIESRDYANYGKDDCCGPYSGKFTTPGGKYPANPFGLFDISGNTVDWVEDEYHSNYNGAPVDGSAWLDGGKQSYRVLRGGSWIIIPSMLRSAGRIGSTPDIRNSNIGFRVARTLVTP